MRPIGSSCYDAPASHEITNPYCFTGVVDSDGQCIPNSAYSSTKLCKNAVCGENNVVQNPQVQNVQPQITGPFSEDMSNKEKQYRHNCGWDNQFAFPYEIGMYWNLTTGGLYISCIRYSIIIQLFCLLNSGIGQRAMGCPGLDEPFDQWPFK